MLLPKSSKLPNIRDRFVSTSFDIIDMNQEEDEDAFLYGESAGTAAAGASFAHTPRAEDGMEPASEEGEVDDDEEDEDGSDSVIAPFSTTPC